MGVGLSWVVKPQKNAENSAQMPFIPGRNEVQQIFEKIPPMLKWPIYGK